MKKVISIILVVILTLSITPITGGASSAELKECNLSIREFALYITQDSIDQSELHNLYSSLDSASSFLTPEEFSSPEVVNYVTSIRNSLNSISATLVSKGYGEFSNAMKQSEICISF